MDVSLRRKGIMRLVVLKSEPNSKGVDYPHKSALCLFFCQIPKRAVLYDHTDKVSIAA